MNQWNNCKVATRNDQRFDLISKMFKPASNHIKCKSRVSIQSVFNIVPNFSLIFLKSIKQQRNNSKKGKLMKRFQYKFSLNLSQKILKQQICEIEFLLFNLRRKTYVSSCVSLAQPRNLKQIPSKLETNFITVENRREMFRISANRVWDFTIMMRDAMFAGIEICHHPRQKSTGTKDIIISEKQPKYFFVISVTN